MAYAKFPVEKLIQPFQLYKLNKCKDTLDDLYCDIDHIIISVTRNISKKFRQKNFSDFEDLQQQVRLDIYRYLPRILENCIDAEQLIRIVVAASVIRFRFAYMNFLKKTPVMVEGGIIKLGGKPHRFDTQVKDFIPRFPVPIFMCFNMSDDVFSNYSKTNPDQIYRLYLVELKTRILAVVKEKNRFPDNENLVLYYIDCYLRDVVPSREILKNIFKANRNGFWAKYSEIVLRSTLLEVLRKDKIGFLNERY
jgi:hypothetical protein